MLNRKLKSLLLILGLLATLILVGCSGNDIEKQIEEAAEKVGEVADEVAENAGEIADQAEEAVDAATDAAAEAVDAATDAVTTEEATDETAMDMGYDMDIYGNIDEIDLSGVEVTFWHRYDSGSRQEETDKIIADFNATNEYGITVLGSAEGHYGQIYDKMIAALTTGDVPDLVVAYQNQAAAFQVADGLVSIEPYLANETYGLIGDDRADFFAAFLESDKLPQFGNEAYGIAPGRSMEMMYYNRDWLAELGYDAPPTTPEEFGEMVCAAAEQPFSKNESDFSAGMELDTDASVVASLIFARGGEIFENGEFAYDSVEAADAMSFYQDLAAKGCILPIAEKYGDQTDFGNGKILFSQGSSSGLPFYKSSIDDGEVGGFEWSVTAIPYTGDHPVQNVYGGSMSIVRTSPEEQLAAWVFLKYFTSAEIQARWAVASNYFPVRQSTAAELGDYIDNNEPYKTAFELLQYGKSEAAVAGYDNVRDAVEEAFIDMLFNGADIAGTLADLDAQANEIMYEAAPDGATRPETPVAPTESAAPDYDTALYGNIEELDVAGTEITFWHRYDSGSRQEETDKIIADFNASNEYGITVIGSAEGHYGQIYDKMIAALTTGDVPDLVVAYQNQAAAFQVADGLVSIDPYINSATFGLDDADRGDFFAAFLESDRLPQFEGAAYGFPPGRSMEMMYYNKDWLAELGYDAPPSTPEEFGEMVCAAAEQRFSKNESDFSAGMELDTDASVVASLIFARGGEIFEDGEFNYDSPEALDAMSFYQGLADQGCILPIAEKYGDQTDFGNGKILFSQGSSSGLPFYKSSIDDGEVGGFEWSITAIPFTGDHPVQNVYGGSISIVHTTPEEQLASWLFLKYFTSSEIQARWAVASNYFPVRQSTADELGDYITSNQPYQAAFELLQYGKAEAAVAGYDNVRDAVEEAFIDILFNGADAASTLADLNAQANEIMAEAAP